MCWSLLGPSLGGGVWPRRPATLPTCWVDGCPERWVAGALLGEPGLLGSGWVLIPLGWLWLCLDWGVCWPLLSVDLPRAAGAGLSRLPALAPGSPRLRQRHIQRHVSRTYTPHTDRSWVSWGLVGAGTPAASLWFFLRGTAGVSGGIGVRCQILPVPKNTHTHTLPSLHCHRLCAAVAVVSFVLCLFFFIVFIIFSFLMVIYLFIYSFIYF